MQAYRQVPIYTREWHKRWSYLEISIDANGRVKLFTDRGSYPLNQRLRLLPAMITSRPTELPGAASFQEQLWRSSSSSSSSSSRGSNSRGSSSSMAAASASISASSAVLRHIKRQIVASLVVGRWLFWFL